MDRDLDLQWMYQECRLCPRNCGVDRTAGQRGICGMGAEPTAARAALHMWEEPCISGEKGSGAVFFSGCTLRCVYCQNHEISHGISAQGAFAKRTGRELSAEELAEVFLRLQEQGAANINLVTAGHFAPSVARAIRRAKTNGLAIPVVFNSGGYETVETLRLLEGLVDVYLPDYKYEDAELAGNLSGAADYPDVAKKAVAEMVRQTGACSFGEDGMILRGTVVRHLVLPGHTRNARGVIRYLYETYHDRIWISLMSQYTPMKIRKPHDAFLDRKVTKREYEKVLDFALELGITNGFFQEGDPAKESFIPAFDLQGL